MNVARKVLAALMAGVMVLIVGILAFVTVRQFVQATRGVDRTVETILRIESVLSLLRESESAQRGYLITGDSAYLRPGPVRDSIAIQLATLRAANDSDPIRLARLDTLSNVVTEKLRDLDEAIATRDQRGIGAALALVRTDRGMHLMAEARRIAAAMEDRERAVLRAQEDGRRRAGSRALWIIALGSTIAVILIVVINRSIRSDVEATMRIAADNARLVLDANEARVEAERSRAAALSASQAKSDFLATMSHEIRTPINAVLGYSELLSLGLSGPLTSDQRLQLDRITASTKHLLGLVNEVLDLAKVESGTMRVDVEVVPAGDTVDAALALVRPQAAARGVTLSERCNGARESKYLGDEPRVRQVLVNLLGNAVKFTDPGGTVTIDCTVAPTPGEPAGLEPGRPYVALNVRDTGAGIPPEQVDRIFEPFVQAESHNRTAYTRNRAGAGLGLSISRQLARLMGGDITVESAVGVGSTFTLWLPVADPLEARQHKAPAIAGAVKLDVTRAVVPAGAADAADEADAAEFAAVADRLLWDVGAIVDAWRRAMRADDAIPTTNLSDAQLDNHTATMVTDIALGLRILGVPDSDRSEMLRDSTAIMRTVAEQHGRQRFALGWSEDAIAREMHHLETSLDDVIATTRRESASAGLQRTRAAARRFVDQATRLSLGAWRVAAQHAQHVQGT
ncbi:MAG TPA: ATP-binding protein [Gemmatimonadaceae bacterium]|nr:ATP-binding protein [Gemmatimonadaceae bacterium]